MLRPYVESITITIRTDHEVSKRVLNIANATLQLTHWRLCIPKFELAVVSHAGIKNQAIHASSRLQTIRTHTELIEHNIPIAKIDSDTLDCTKIPLENSYQSVDQVVADIDFLEKGQHRSL